MENLVNVVTKQPSGSCGSSQVGAAADDLKVTADIRIRGTNDVRDRIARALSAKTASVTVNRYRYNKSRLAVCCSGKWQGKKIFAKILLANPYPIPPRFRAPWETPFDATMPVRPVNDQIDIEWNMALKMRALSGGDSVPAPLGRSQAARTVVWEEAEGISLIQALKWSRWKSAVPAAGEQALFRAGRWLRNVHEASRRGTEIIEARDLVQTASCLARQKERKAWYYENMAAKILEASLPEMGDKGKFAVAVAFTHGDFCLSNLLWDITGKELAVIDFEFSDFRPVFYDLFALIGEIRSELLNPLIPKSVIHSWEESFWRGYGPVSAPVMAFVKALALARVFYYHFPRLLTRRERKGLIGGFNAQLYQMFLEGRIIAQRLDLPQELAAAHSG